MSFNPLTAYSNDWEYLDDVLDATHIKSNEHGGDDSPSENQTACKAKRINETTSEYRELARAFGFTTTETVFRVWDHNRAGIALAANDQLRIVDLPDGVNAVTETWIVRRVERERFGGHWIAGCTKAASNA